MQGVMNGKSKQKGSKLNHALKKMACQNTQIVLALASKDKHINKISNSLSIYLSTYISTYLWTQ